MTAFLSCLFIPCRGLIYRGAQPRPHGRERHQLMELLMEEDRTTELSSRAGRSRGPHALHHSEQSLTYALGKFKYIMTQ